MEEVLCGSHFLRSLVSGRSVAVNCWRKRIDERQAQGAVRVDLECSSAHIEVRGLVSGWNIRALYVLAKRANSIVPGLEVVFDLAGANVKPEALKQLNMCRESRHLPVVVDPMQADFRLNIIPPAHAAHPTMLGLTA
jgi:hypothetical protein